MISDLYRGFPNLSSTITTGEIKKFWSQVNQTVFIQAIIQITDLLALTKTP